MKSLYLVNVNWHVFIGIALLLLFIPGINIYFFLALVLTLHQFLLLFYSIGYIIPIRYLFGSLMCLQMLLGPVLAYSFEGAKGMMQIPADEYFAYVLPAVICFIIGLHISCKNLAGETIDLRVIGEYFRVYKTMPFIFIVLGFIASFISGMFSSDLAFVFYLIGGLKFIGVFMIIVSSNQIKIIPLVIVYSSVIISSLNNAMFHDLVTWLIFLGIFYCIQYKPSINIKLVGIFLFVIFAIVLQSIKKDYRQATWEQNQNANLQTLSNVYEQTEAKSGFFNSKDLIQNITRINQGFIITNIMKTVPDVVPFSEGEQLRQILTAAILPRIIAPNKLTAGNQDIYKKYTGMQLRKGTSMALSSIGDAYINFGIIGGCVFMFTLGLLYSESLKLFNRYSKYFPILLLFTPLVFYYPIRPDCELQTILGHFVKSIFLIFIIFLIWKKQFLFRFSRS